MKRTMVLLLCIALAAVNICYVPLVSAEEVISGNIASELTARKIAARAGGRYVKDLSTVEVTESQIALPIVHGDTGEILGYIVARQDRLVAVLKELGLGDVAAAVASVPATAAAGAAAGTTAAAGISAGTVVTAAAVVSAAALAIISVNGGGDTTTTSQH